MSAFYLKSGENMKKKITITGTCIVSAMIIGTSLMACQHKKTSEPAPVTSQSETGTATPSPTITMKEKKTDKNQEKETLQKSSTDSEQSESTTDTKKTITSEKLQTIVNEEGEPAVLFPEETQSGAENTVDTSDKKDDDGKKEETDNKQNTKKDPEKQPDQKDPEITANSLSELPMVPFED